MNDRGNYPIEILTTNGSVKGLNEVETNEPSQALLANGASPPNNDHEQSMALEVTGVVEDPNTAVSCLSSSGLLDEGDRHGMAKENTQQKSLLNWSLCVERLEQSFRKWYARHRTMVSKLTRGLALVAYLVYFGYCMSYRFGDEGSILLLGFTAILVMVILWRLFPSCWSRCGRLISLLTCSPRLRCIIRYGLYVAAVIALAAYLWMDVFAKQPKNVQSLLGVFGIIFFCFIFSTKPSKVNWHPVFWGFVIQLCFAAMTLQTAEGYAVFQWLGDGVQYLLSFSHKGSVFVLGPNYATMGLAFKYAGVMIFFGSLMGLLIHYGIIGFLVIRGGHALSLAMDTRPVESVIAVSNIFIGLSQAPLLVLPYLSTMSRSELGALMTCGFASVSGDAMAVFISYGAPANHLLTAAIISAPAALAIAKLLMPETGQVDRNAKEITHISSVAIGGDKSQNALSAASDGALVAVRLVVSAMVNMLAFVSLLSLIDAILAFFGERAGISGLTFDAICGYLLFPLTFAMGTPYEDCSRVGSLIGLKLFATPVAGYIALGKLVNNRMVLEDYIATENGTWHWEGNDVILDQTNMTLIDGFMTAKGEAISTYAMCGFSAFTAIGICLGALTSLCPERKSEIISLVLPAFLGGNMASFATGAVAGLMYTER